MDDDAETALAEAKRKRDEELAYIMKEPHGRRFVWRLLNQVCAIESSCFSNDALMMAYSQGRKDVGLDVLAALQDFDKETFLKMETENR